ncbi:hypothetical protein EJ08DRAFT_702676 [Tothia fuscella]|uniref:F-box domain-containing protein n=1 Tax=Tothia fuscella TaxID=1048955 RepID=A0A9P4NFX8_9PEZI|nr:hypothetical protein EJ08DRAFT_702676 [Tothia fuscella]
MAKGFLDLPAEIRIQIYKSCFFKGKSTEVNLQKSERLSSQLLRTCSQVYHEGLEFLYSSNTFLFGAKSDWKSHQAFHGEHKATIKTHPSSLIKHVQINDTYLVDGFNERIPKLSGLTDVCLIFSIVMPSYAAGERFTDKELFDVLVSETYTHDSWAGYNAEGFKTSSIHALLVARSTTRVHLLLEIDSTNDTRFNMCYDIVADPSVAYGHTLAFVKRLKEVRGEYLHWDEEEYVEKVEEVVT